MPLMLLIMLSGCASWGFGFSSGSVSQSRTAGAQGSRQSVDLSVSSDSRILTGLLAGILFAEGVRYYVRGDDGLLTPVAATPDPEPGRRISEQDCTRPLVQDGGNLRCR